jgi:rhodanese-related sulfurtransferase
MVQRVDVDRMLELVGDGAQLVDVLPASVFAQEHLPGAVNVPLASFDAAVERVDIERALVVYCFDQH